MLVTAVRSATVFGEAMIKSAGDFPHKGMRLSSQLNKLRNVVQNAGLVASILTSVILFINLIIDGKSQEAKPSLPGMKGKPAASEETVEIIKKLVINLGASKVAPLLIVLHGISGGMEFAIDLASTYSSKKMLSGKASAPRLLDLVKMGSVTTLFVDKTTLNPVDVAMCFFGDDDIIQTGLNVAEVATSVRQTLFDGISTPLIRPSSHAGRETIEDPLLRWAALNLHMKPDVLRQNTVMETKRLSLNEEGSGVLMKKKQRTDDGRDDRVMYVHWKGTATTILGKSSSYYDKNYERKALDEDKRKDFEEKIEQMKRVGLATVAFACKQIGAPTLEDNDLILIAILGLKKHTCCAAMKEELRFFKDAGVKIVLFSEDDYSEVKEIATACGILPEDGLVISREDFHNLDDDERMDKVEKICALSNALPSDKTILMQCLKKKDDNNMVVTLGTTTSEAPAFKEADLGIAMGDRSSHMAKESSDIIIRDGSLSSLRMVIVYGRCTCSNIRKYIQVVLVTTIAGTLLTLITTIITIWHRSSQITGIQLIWVTFLMTVLAGPALLLEPPRDELMHKPPVAQSGPLISKPMWRNIVVQALYQTTILIAFPFLGEQLELSGITEVSKSMIFNAFFLCQVFNLVNSRELEKMNFFIGICQNWWLFVAVAFVVTLQFGFIEMARLLVDDAGLDFKQWSVCFSIGICSWSWDLAAKSVSNFVVNRKLGSRGGTAATVHSASPG